MNDQFKKYIDENRDEFDHLEPSAAVFQKIKSKLNTAPQKGEKKGVIKFALNYKWVVAASVVVTMFITYFMLNNNSEVIKDKTTQITNTTLPQAKNEIAISDIPKTSNIKYSYAQNTKQKSAVKDLKDIDLNAVYTELNDSTSSSTRLAAILKIQNANVINYDIIDKLSKTLNADGNSNVRLAALNLMSNYAQDSYVANAFLQSLVNQKDPLVQLGLIELLKHTNNPKLDDKLYALTNDPTTFEAVKDEAYLVLLNQNKL